MNKRDPGSWICGVDEVGRGPLAGAVVAAAVILDPARPIAGLADSKKLSPRRRETLDAQIRERSLAWAIGRAEVEEIDRLNILHASLLAMRRAVESRSPAGQGADRRQPGANGARLSGRGHRRRRCQRRMHQCGGDCRQGPS